MDKNGVALPAWRALGLAFVEVGTVTALPQAGNRDPGCSAWSTARA
jgi:dihydroorotate dehydrogenase